MYQTHPTNIITRSESWESFIISSVIETLELKSTTTTSRNYPDHEICDIKLLSISGNFVNTDEVCSITQSISWSTNGSSQDLSFDLSRVNKQMAHIDPLTFTINSIIQIQTHISQSCSFLESPSSSLFARKTSWSAQMASLHICVQVQDFVLPVRSVFFI